MGNTHTHTYRIYLFLYDTYSYTYPTHFIWILRCMNLYSHLRYQECLRFYTQIKKKHLKKEDILDKVNRVERSKKDHFKSYNPIYIPKIVDSFNTEESKKILSQLNGLSPSHS